MPQKKQHRTYQERVQNKYKKAANLTAKVNSNALMVVRRATNISSAMAKRARLRTSSSDASSEEVAAKKRKQSRDSKGKGKRSGKNRTSCPSQKTDNSDAASVRSTPTSPNLSSLPRNPSTPQARSPSVATVYGSLEVQSEDEPDNVTNIRRDPPQCSDRPKTSKNVRKGKNRASKEEQAAEAEQKIADLAQACVRCC